MRKILLVILLFNSFNSFASKEKEKHYNIKILVPIQKMIQILESGTTGYQWSDNTSCNVGLFAQLIGNMTAGEVRKELSKITGKGTDYDKYANSKWPGETGSWTCMLNYYCGITNKPMTGIIGKLQKQGFTANDLRSLEYLNDPLITKRIKKNLEKDTKEDLILYLKAWAWIIKDEYNLN